jgi:hypothetical protein
MEVMLDIRNFKLNFYYFNRISAEFQWNFRFINLDKKFLHSQR